jgi:hypothetical protein
MPPSSSTPDGRVLYQVHADQRRFPASLTKMMTVLMLFEALDSGTHHQVDPIPVSEYARARPPTKIGFRAAARSTSTPPFAPSSSVPPMTWRAPWANSWAAPRNASAR